VLWLEGVSWPEKVQAAGSRSTAGCMCQCQLRRTGAQLAIAAVFDFGVCHMAQTAVMSPVLC
jgi:hypothetical protein